MSRNSIYFNFKLFMVNYYPSGYYDEFIAFWLNKVKSFCVNCKSFQKLCLIEKLCFTTRMKFVYVGMWESLPKILDQNTDATRISSTIRPGAFQSSICPYGHWTVSSLTMWLDIEKVRQRNHQQPKRKCPLVNIKHTTTKHSILIEMSLINKI